MKIFESYKEKNNNRKNNEEIIMSIIRAKSELNTDIKNYEYADGDQIDYYLYKIKANKAKFDYLIKKAKENNIEVSNIEKLKYEA